MKAMAAIVRQRTNKQSTMGTILPRARSIKQRNGRTEIQLPSTNIWRCLVKRGETFVWEPSTKIKNFVYKLCLIFDELIHQTYHVWHEISHKGGNKDYCSNERKI